MELWLLVKLIQRLDGLTQKSIGRVIGDFERFLADPAAYLEGRDLTGEERAALLRHDYTTLYGLGAHPFLLWPFTARLAAAQGRTGREVMREYMAAITPLGRPDYST